MLDRDLERMRDRWGGRVCEVGAGRLRRRGAFRPPIEQAELWLSVDIRESVQPHVCADVQHLPLKDASVDTLVCLEMMEYVQQPAAALREMRRVLRPTGTLILATPFLHRADSPQDYWRFTEPALRWLLGESGFAVERIHSQGAALAVVSNILHYTIAAIPNAWCRVPLAAVAYLPLRAFLSLDEPLARWIPVLRTFSTGYLVLGRAHA